MKTVITFGVFDFLHFGHIRLFRNIRSMVGEPCRLVVIIHTSEYVQQTKPGTKMLYTTAERIEMLHAIRTIDEVVIHPDSLEYVAGIDFDVFARGEDQNSERLLTFDKWCRENGKEIIRTPRTEGIASSDIKSSIVRDLW
ncbi:MAG: adenylyltransferase/cytidyltransferase family protein [Planctomycetaceae bacterium]|jgi:cytidyltransferase-like protein|nr:adenylyltransferase/cytidyltransferase family protein [Planctomycetaceae bacterium]